MLSLIIDIGNTRVKAAVFNYKNECVHKVVVTSLEELVTLEKQHLILKIGVISVGLKTQDYKDWLEKINQTKPVFYIDNQSNIPIVNQYQTPLTLGIDRLCNVIAASTLYNNKTTLTIDAGTCIKYDLIDNENKYKGGNISPGLAMRYKALNHYTEKLPNVTFNKPQALYGNTTESCIQTGVFNGMLNEINGMINQYMNNEKVEQIILTGGDAEFFENSLNFRTFAQPNLSLLGAHIILNHNVPYN
jgi:type III pantothenate kinase